MNASAIRQAISAISQQAATCDSEAGRRAVLLWCVNKLASEANARVVVTRPGAEMAVVEKLSEALVDAIRAARMRHGDELGDVVGRHIDTLYVEVWGHYNDEDDSNIWLALL